VTDMLAVWHCGKSLSSLSLGFPIWSTGLI
jgi:hypothetical protein